MANHDTYCKLLATKHTFNEKYDISADFGEQPAPVEITERLKGMTSEIEALNYMASNGWELVSSLTNQLVITKFILRKKQA